MSTLQVFFGLLLVVVNGELQPEHGLSAGHFVQADQFKSSAIGDGSISHGSIHQQPTATSYQSFFLESKDPIPVKLASDKSKIPQLPQLPHFLPEDSEHHLAQTIQLSNGHDLGQQLVVSHTNDQQLHQVAFSNHQTQDFGGQVQVAFNNGGDIQTHVVQQHQPDVLAQYVSQLQSDPAPQTIPSAEEASQVGYHAGDLTFLPQPTQIRQQQQVQQDFTGPVIDFQSDDYTYEIHEGPSQS